MKGELGKTTKKKKKSGFFQPFLVAPQLTMVFPGLTNLQKLLISIVIWSRHLADGLAPAVCTEVNIGVPRGILPVRPRMTSLKREATTY